MPMHQVSSLYTQAAVQISSKIFQRIYRMNKSSPGCPVPQFGLDTIRCTVDMLFTQTIEMITTISKPGRGTMSDLITTSTVMGMLHKLFLSLLAYRWSELTGFCRSVSFRMADRSKYYYNNVKKYSRYTLPNGEIIFNRNNPDVQGTGTMLYSESTLFSA
jgi:hypothetical protein